MRYRLQLYFRGMHWYSALALLFPLMGTAQDLEKTLLWRIGSTDGTASGYLYGTVHSKDDRAFQFGDSVLPALDRCRVAAGELDLDRSAQGGLALMTTMRMPDGQRLEDLYRKKDWKRVNAALQEHMGFMAPMATRLKPFFVLMLLTENAMGGEQPAVLDEYLQLRAKEQGHRVIGIETMNEQIAALDAITMKEQAAMLLDHVDHDGYPAEMDAMLDAYAAQDLEGLVEAAERTGSMPDAMERALLTDRNTRIVHRMDSVLRLGESVFFLIGAAHLPGPVGLIQGLRTQGYTVVPVMSVATKPEGIEEER